MKIGIIGAGNVGAALARAWSAVGHQIRLGVRDQKKPSTLELVKQCGSETTLESVAGAANFGEVIVLATPWRETRAVIESAGDLSGKIVLDCTNPLTVDYSGLTIGHQTSAAEQIAGWAPAARIVKCFNTTGAGNLEKPRYDGDAIVMFLCGDDEPSNLVVMRLGEDLGFEMVDAGSLKTARLLEPVAMLWIHLAYKRKLGTNFAFKLLRR